MCDLAEVVEGINSCAVLLSRGSCFGDMSGLVPCVCSVAWLSLRFVRVILSLRFLSGSSSADMLRFCSVRVVWGILDCVQHVR